MYINIYCNVARNIYPILTAYPASVQMLSKAKSLTEFDLAPEILEILEDNSITTLYPPQAEALPHALAGKNLVLAIPTASGKSLIAYLAILKSVLAGGKALYIVPLRALATEKFEELKKFESLGLKVELSMGNLDSPDPKLNEFDIIIATSEKTDSLLRHRSFWLKNITVIVADEIHLINDPSRGPTLELILARFKQMNPDAQLLGLSATIQNSMELATWLDAKHIQSTWRPVKLLEGIYYDGNINFLDNTKRPIQKKTDEVTSLILDIIKEDGQALVFVNTRRSTEALARRLAKPVKRLLNPEEQKKLDDICERFLGNRTEVTTLAKHISEQLSAGVAFHHAGLADDQRKFVEQNFKSGLLKCIIATPTLAAGINLPARRVIIRDLYRYDVELGTNSPIPLLEIKQMMGRAGRPRYDPVGEAVLIAKDQYMMEELREQYLLRDTEPIFSKLGIERALRTHVLAAIASGFVKNDRELEEYIGNSFYACQSESYTLSGQLENVLRFLEEQELIITMQDGTGFMPTEFGRRTSDLYLDPETAVSMRRSLEHAADKDVTELAYLHAICATPDMLTFYLRRMDYEWVEGVVTEESEKFIHYWHETPVGYEDFLSQVKTAYMILDWIEERGEEHISQKYNIGPGDIRNKVETGRWLLYSMSELAQMFNSSQQKPIIKLMVRVTYGVTAELLDLVTLRGIGRVRARSLYKHGYKTKKDLKKVSADKLARIPTIGPKLAEDIKNQI
ncbi:DEAD/DEAH box helicase [[Eubacterium] cellulosolvens]